MTFDELQKAAARPARMLEALAVYARDDEFAPWVAETLERAAHYASLSDEALAEFKEAQ